MINLITLAQVMEELEKHPEEILNRHITFESSVQSVPAVLDIIASIIQAAGYSPLDVKAISLATYALFAGIVIGSEVQRREQPCPTLSTTTIH